MKRKLGIDPIELSQWADSDRQAFATAAVGWSPDVTRTTARSFGRLLTFAGGAHAIIDHTVVRRFAEVVKTRLSPGAAHSILKFTAKGLLNLRPDQNWAWFLQENRLLLRTIRGTKPRPARTGPTIAIKFENWPEADQKAWLRGIAPITESVPSDDLLAAVHARIAAVKSKTESEEPRFKSKPARHPSKWSKSTESSAKRGWSYWLFWCASTGRPASEVTADALDAYVEDIYQRGCMTNSIRKYVFELQLALRVLRPEDKMPWLTKLCMTLDFVAAPADKFDRLIPLTDVVEMAATLMAEARSTGRSVHQAVKFRDGLILMLLAWRPKRRRNISEIRIGTELLFDENASASKLVFVRTKNGSSSSNPFPKPLVAIMREYLDYWRPILNPFESDALWLSEHGNPVSGESLAGMIFRRSGKYLGRKFGPHFIRTLYATSLGAEDPELFRSISIALDHRDQKTVEIYKAVAGSSNAARHLQNVLHPLIEPVLNLGKPKLSRGRAVRRAA